MQVNDVPLRPIHSEPLEKVESPRDPTRIIIPSDRNIVIAIEEAAELAFKEAGVQPPANIEDAITQCSSKLRGENEPGGKVVLGTYYNSGVKELCYKFNIEWDVDVLINGKTETIRLSQERFSTNEHPGYKFLELEYDYGYRALMIQQATNTAICSLFNKNSENYAAMSSLRSDLRRDDALEIEIPGTSFLGRLFGKHKYANRYDEVKVLLNKRKVTINLLEDKFRIINHIANRVINSSPEEQKKLMNRVDLLQRIEFETDTPLRRLENTPKDLFVRAFETFNQEAGHEKFKMTGDECLDYLTDSIRKNYHDVVDEVKWTKEYLRDYNQLNEKQPISPLRMDEFKKLHKELMRIKDAIDSDELEAKLRKIELTRQQIEALCEHYPNLIPGNIPPPDELRKQLDEARDLFTPEVRNSLEINF